MTRELVRIPSVNPDLDGPGPGTGEERIAGVCARWLEGWGLRVRTREPAPGRVSVLATLEGTGPGPTLLLNGHLDTVGTSGMTVSPFEARVEGDRLVGRGACDMKSGVAAVLWTARRIATGGPRPGSLVVALTADEEHASIGLLDLLHDGLRADAAVVTEPTSLALMPANKGFLVARLRVTGLAAHGSRPELGRDAIRGAGRVLAALDLFDEAAAGEAPHPLLGRPSVHAGTIHGGTAVSVYPDRCELLLEVRTLPGEREDDAVARLRPAVEEARSRAPELGFELEPLLFRPGAEVPADEPLVRALGAALEAEGEEVRIEGMSAWVEAALLVEAGIPALCFGPGSIGKAHSADEFVPLDEIDRAARVLHRFTESFLRGTAARAPAGGDTAP